MSLDSPKRFRLIYYSDSESSHDDEVCQADHESVTSSKSLPPLSADFLAMNTSSVRWSTAVNDPSLHDGRQRQVPHVPGNWNTHVQLEWWPTSEQLLALSKLHDVLRNFSSDCVKEDTALIMFNMDSDGLHPLYLSELNSPAPLHISLSASLMLKTPLRTRFLHALTKRLGKFRRLKYDTHSSSSQICLRLKASQIAWRANSSSTRWFLVIPVITNIEKHAVSPLFDLLTLVNQTVEEFSLPLLYKEEVESYTKATATYNGNPFHVSLFWRLSSPPTRQQNMLDSRRASTMPMMLTRALDHLESVTCIPVSCVKVCIGNQVHCISI